MLQKLDDITIRRLRVAERLQDIDPSEFDMSSACMCVAGHTLREFGHAYLVESGEWSAIARRARDLLGLDVQQAAELFTPDNYTGRRYHAKDAARVMRYLAATDTVDWDVGGWQRKVPSWHSLADRLAEITCEDILELA